MVLKEHQQKPHPNDSKVDVVGGAGLQFRQGKKPRYIPYELSDNVIDWKSMWFYVRNLSSSLPLRTPGPPVKRPSWNSRGGRVDQVNFLLGGEREGEGGSSDYWCFCGSALVSSEGSASTTVSSSCLSVYG